MKKKSTNIFAIIVGLLMVFAFMPLNMGQAYAETETIVDGVHYALNDDEMTATVIDCDDDQSEITIPVTVGDNPQYTVKSIANGAFNSKSGLTKVEFAEGSQLESIAQDAFAWCTSLESIIIPASVENIGEGAFWKSGVHAVTFEEKSKLKNIGNSAFWKCDSLESIIIPASVESIGDSAFLESNVQSVLFEKNSKLKSIGACAFMACDSLESIIIPASVESIGERSFESSGVQSVSFEKNSKLKSIGACAFMLCDSLESIIIPASVESIGERSFDSSGVQSVSFEENSKLKSIENRLFNSCTRLESIDVPTSVERIGDDAFNGCTSLSYIAIPSSVTSINNGAFYGCDAITTFNYLGPKAQWDTLSVDTGFQVQDGHEIFFKNSDGTELQYSIMKSGFTPQYVGAIPYIEADEQYIYTFAGWYPEITAADGDATYTAKYSKTERISLKGAKVVLSAKAFTYNGKVRKPTIKTIGGKKLTAGTDYEAAWANSKNVGSYTVTVTGKGKYTGTAKATYKINPKGTSITSTKKAKKAFTVKWKKQPEKMSKSRITGYQVRYSTKSSMKGAKTVTVKGYAKTTAKITKLKKKTKYYVQVRTFKTISSANYYSGWSKKSTVKTK